jgi:hypothetical protein
MRLAEGFTNSYSDSSESNGFSARLQLRTRRKVAFVKARILIISIVLSCPAILAAQGLDTAKN